MKKVILRILLVLAILIAGLVIYVFSSWNKDYDVPLPQISASTDSVIIARGKYLAYGPAHCASCHTPMEYFTEIDQGKEIPLSGGWELSIPPGTFRAPNLTPDPETGIGNTTDAQLARAIRHSIGIDGKYLGPFMEYQNLSDEDLTAIISFLRSQKPVVHQVEPTKLSFLGKALLAFNALQPVQPWDTPPETIAIDSTAAYGSYLANSVANCLGCHTERDMITGMYSGPAMAGGMQMPPDNLTKGYAFITPNLTPDPETGVIADWTEEAFITRMRAGRSVEVSPMPWGSFSRSDEMELKALYNYFMSLDPVHNAVPKTVFLPGEEM